MVGHVSRLRPGVSSDQAGSRVIQPSGRSFVPSDGGIAGGGADGELAGSDGAKLLAGEP
jgi:hypothetical protein